MIDTKRHLCSTCIFNYPECPGDDIVFGDGIGNDNICECKNYLPYPIHEKTEE